MNAAQSTAVLDSGRVCVCLDRGASDARDTVMISRRQHPRALRIDQAIETVFEADTLDAFIGRGLDNGADHRVQARAVAAAGQHADASRHHASSSGILRAGAVPGRYASVVLAAWSPLQWTFAIALGAILGVSGLIVLYVVARLFVNPARRARTRTR